MPVTDHQLPGSFTFLDSLLTCNILYFRGHYLAKNRKEERKSDKFKGGIVIFGIGEREKKDWGMK